MHWWLKFLKLKVVFYTSSSINGQINFFFFWQKFVEPLKSLTVIAHEDYGPIFSHIQVSEFYIINNYLSLLYIL